MSSTHIQLVKWTFPAFALLIGILWYKRRRVDRADPGGISESDSSEKNFVDLKGTSPKADSCFHDSGILDDMACSVNSPSQSREEFICTPRKKSESLDIPQRKANSQCMSTHSEIISTDNQEWYSYMNSTMEIEVQLGSNPKRSNFDLMIKSRNASSLENAVDSSGKMSKIFENVEEEEQKSDCHNNNSVEFVNTNEENDANNECNYPPSKESLIATPPEDNVKTPVQVLCDRDSANHSPLSGVLEDGVTDEISSEGSTDSGKGGSIRGKDILTLMMYEFHIPQSLVGRLIGRQGSFLRSVRRTANVNVTVTHDPMSSNQQICAIVGYPAGISAALKLIREKFPDKKYPDVTLEQIGPIKQLEPMVTQILQLSLVDGMNNDVVVCHVAKPNRIFVQLPTHPTYQSLRILSESMTQLYNTTESPPVPDKLTKGMILVANCSKHGWVRVYIEKPDPLGIRHLTRLLDYGGYWYFSNADLRTIRSDYLTLPFQAIEVFLANIQPKNGEWTRDAYDIVAQTCFGVIVQAQIVGYSNMNTYINLYFKFQNHGVISLADELVARGLAESVPWESMVPEEDISIS